jgi:hypothetical protein
MRSFVPKETPPNPNTDRIAARLNDGLKACRSIVSNYKALLEGDQKDAEASPDFDESVPPES